MIDQLRGTEPGRAARAMCKYPHEHPGHIWFRANGDPRWCAGVNVVRWYNALVEQQGHDRQAEQ